MNQETLKEEIRNFAKVSRKVYDKKIGNHRCLALAEKRIPFTSEFIDSEDLPKLCLNYLEKAYPIYKYFTD